MINYQDVMKQALEALESCQDGDYTTGDVLRQSFDEQAVNAAIVALWAALSQEQAEPVQSHRWEGDHNIESPNNACMHKSYCISLKAKPVQEPVAWIQPKTVDSYLRPDLGYETCSKTDYGAFPVYIAPPKAEPAQEPVAEVFIRRDGVAFAFWLKVPPPTGTKLYTAPPKPLTDEEFDALCEANSFGAVARGQFPLIPRSMLKALVDAAIERTHGIGGQE